MKVLACDLGASNGRVMLGEIRDQRIHLQELHRFPNEPQTFAHALYWDVLRLFCEIKKGMAIAAASGETIEGIGICTWGNTIALFDEANELAANPYHYRDTYPAQVLGDFERMCPPEHAFRQTGYVFMSIQPAVFLYYLKQKRPKLLECARKALMITDCFNYALSGTFIWEKTIAATSQLVDMRTGDWNREYMRDLGIREGLFGTMTPSGTVIGEVRPAIVRETGMVSAPKVVAVAGHDTACAAATIRARRPEDSLYLSCGTWSCMGCTTPRPIMTKEMEKSGATNDLGAFGEPQIRFNHTGLWILQQIKKQWEKEGEGYSWEQISEMAAGASAFTAVIDTEDDLFFAGDSMASKVQEYCMRTAQRIPRTKGEVVRTVLESLAFRYRYSADVLQRVSGISFSKLHMIGGGSRNRLLCQYTANALAKPVIGGAQEATALGNVMMQGIALGAFESRAQAQEAANGSYEETLICPENTGIWEEKYQNAIRIAGWK